MKRRRHSIFPQLPPSAWVQDCGHRRAFLMTAEDAGGEQGADCALCLLEDFIDSNGEANSRIWLAEKALAGKLKVTG